MSEIEEQSPSTTRSTTVVLMAIGAVLLPLGLLVIGLGWYGASHTPYVFEQNSYLISGGMLGLGLVFVGGFLYFGAWIARLAQATHYDTERLIVAMERVTAASAAPSPTGGSFPPASDNLVATPTGSMLHRADCAVVVNRDDVHAVKPDAKGLQPCRLCDPLGDGTRPPVEKADSPNGLRTGVRASP